MIDIEDVNSAIGIIKNFCIEHPLCASCPFESDEQSRDVCKFNERTPYYWEVK